MRIVYHLPNDDLVKARDTAKAAELAGFDGVVALENAHGPFPPLSVAALTQKIQLGTGVAIAFLAVLRLWRTRPGTYTKLPLVAFT